MQAVLNPTFGERLKSLLRLLATTALFSVSGIVAISAWQNHADAARRAVADRLPRLAPIVSPRTDQAGMTVGVSMEATPQADSGGDVAVTGTLARADSAQLLQSLVRDVAAMGQDLAELKERVGRLASGQDQMARDLARIRQASPRPDVRSAMAAAPSQSLSVTPDARRPVSSSLPPTLRPR